MHPRRSNWTFISEVSLGSALLILGFSFYSWGMDKLTNTPAHEHRRLAIEALTARDYETAIAEYKKAADLDPGNAVIPYELGMAYKDAGNTTQAVESWAQSLRIDPKMRQASDAVRSVGFEKESSLIGNMHASQFDAEDSRVVRSLSVGVLGAELQ